MDCIYKWNISINDKLSIKKYSIAYWSWPVIDTGLAVWEASMFKLSIFSPYKSAVSGLNVPEFHICIESWWQVVSDSFVHETQRKLNGMSATHPDSSLHQFVRRIPAERDWSNFPEKIYKMKKSITEKYNYLKIYVIESGQNYT